MARPSQVLLKRKRKLHVDSSGSDRDSDIIAVKPRRAVAVVVTSARTPLREAQAKTSVARRTLTTSVAGTSTTPATPQTATASQTTPSPADDEVPDNCCYHCLGRGGQAAYNCRYEDGQESCNLCIREKKGQCRLPTEEEKKKSAARCERCKVRGFKTCNGARPYCDTCIRHNTQEACWKPRTKPAKCANLPAAEAVTSGSADDSKPIKKSVKKKRKVGVDQSLKTISDSRDDVTDATTPPRHVARPRRGARKIESPSPPPSGYNHTTVPDELSVHDEDSPAHDAQQRSIAAQKDVSSVEHDMLDDQDCLGEVMDLDAGTGLEYAVLDEREDSDDQRVGRMGISSSLSSRKARSTDVTSVTDEDEAQIQPELQEHIEISPPKDECRPRRSRARVSYVEPSLDIFSDHELKLDENESNEHDDTGSDVYVSRASASNVSDNELELEDLGDVESSINGEDSALYDEDHVEVAADLNSSKPKARSRVKPKSSAVKQSKGIDFTLPPINSVETAFSDMTAKGIELGLADILKQLKGKGYQFNVATMCSGTESPFLAMDLISEALEEAGHAPLIVHQKFAAEIDVFKQAFIERNQSPEKIFRDVREFIPADAKTAITAYGAEEEIPSGLDMLIAGFVCKDLSRLNSQQKGLEDDGESGDTWRAIYSYSERFRPRIVLLENVKGTTKLWNGLVSMWDKIGYEAAWLIRDTKHYRIPQTRERMYMIAIERKHFGDSVKEAVEKWQDSMEELQRQCSSPYEAWLQNMLHDSSEHNVLVNEVDWALCKLRYDRIRSDERLGVLRPVTRWSENGTVRPPDFANRAWYNSQSSRVYDAIDVAHLQAAQKGYDSLYKMGVLDVSQNVDRFKTALGILPCITPGGCDFATNRQVSLSGKQLLLLQGMPMDKLLFGTETQKECQNLAGNAMTTTVIGASIISAIISGSKAFRSSSLTDRRPTGSLAQKALATPRFVRLDPMASKRLASAKVEQLDITKLAQDALMSARLCNCEGDLSLSKARIQVCSDCGYTACEKCAGNPRHHYKPTFSRASRSQTPVDFIQKWKPELPARLRFSAFPDIRRLIPVSRSQHQTMATYVDHVVKLQVDTQYFCLRGMLRQEYGWKIIYSSAEVELELRVGQELHWLLFVSCPREFPGDDPLRKLFQSPLARAKVVDSLLDLEWEVRFPNSAQYKLQINGSGVRHNSWRNRLGLLDFKEETVPVSLQVKSQSEDCKNLEGSFDLLPDCGTASSSLYKRASSPTLYLFLDPKPLDNPENDAFVFSEDCSRKHYGDTRLNLANLDASWRPWHVQERRAYDVGATLSETWVTTDMKLSSINTNLTVGILSGTAFGEKNESDCSNAVVILEARLPEQLPVKHVEQYSWVLERAKRLPSLSVWQPMNTSSSHACACAPKYPDILWSVSEKGIATPQEARKAAANFERAMKTRAAIFHVNATSTKRETSIQIALNIAALVHRAEGRLQRTGPLDIAWRLATDHADIPHEPYSKFRLMSNSNDSAFEATPVVNYLRNAQPRSLSWMKAQEQGRQITIPEVEEAVHTGFGWRAEARAQTNSVVHGGVLADLPSFGKTVTCIALIQSEFEQHNPEAVLHNNRKLCHATEGLIESAATLIICPPHLALQWQTELKRFLGNMEYENYNVLVLQTFAELRAISIDDVKASRIVVLSWSVFAEDDYISHLAYFTAMPEPSITGRRAFDTWFSQAVKDIPDQICVLENAAGYDSFNVSTSKLLEERLGREEFKVALPLKVSHGSAYKSFNAIQAETKLQSKSAKVTSKQMAAKFDGADQQVPLPHLFHFNRVVVDEYHYLNDDKKLSNFLASVSAKRIEASKRWVLSGTPALANFSDVDQIASYLGIKLGRYHFGDGMETTQADKMRRSDQTPVEDFLSQTETMSRQWHRARHERAQEFLDLFVRQNEASLGHVSCAEKIVPIELDIGHHAVYLELSQYLISQKMQIKKLNKKGRSDKMARLNASLSNSSSAEDALLKSALSFRTSDGRSALKFLSELRSEQRSSIQAELKELMAGFEGLSKTKEILDLYDRFKDDITNLNWLSDSDATRFARNLLIQASRAPDSSIFSELRGETALMKAKLTKQRLSSLRVTAQDLAHHMRSERFINAIKNLLGPLAGENKGQRFMCSCPDCDGTAKISELHLITHCGHTACAKCLATRTDHETCVDPECNSHLQGVNLVKATDLGSTIEPESELWFGRKIQAVIEIIKKLPKGDQGVVFAPNDETLKILEGVLESHEIPYHTLRGCRAVQSAKLIEDFKTNDDPDQQSKVLILNMGSESAAGANLVNANHVIFLAPLLTKTQYEYDSAMAQAVARCRRYGQKKTVHIYHIIAQRTIDVDILEHRHKRVDGITTSKSTMKMPETLATKEKTKLVRNKKGQMALVPVSWLADAEKRKVMGVGDMPESFASLISFSDTFQHDED